MHRAHAPQVELVINRIYVSGFCIFTCIFSRRLLLDDAKGVTEALNEKAYGVGLVAKGKG